MRHVVTFLSLALLSVGATRAAAEETKIVVDGSTTVGPIAKALAEHAMSENPDVDISVSESGSGNGAKSLINGTCDVADMSRFMKAKEFEAAVAKDIMPVAHVVAVDGLAVVVHPSNRITGLTIDQVQAIYQGKIKNWSELGGPSMPIVKIGRDTNSGTYETFENLVMKKTRVSGDTETTGSNGGVRARVQKTPAAIGYVGLGFVDRTLKPLTINKIGPSRSTIASGVYPIARPLFMFTNGYPRLGTPLHAFVTLHLSEKGQEIIEAIGFVPVTDY